ncbi:MAG: RNA-binding S4 domain-containing protein [Flavobacteriales bacterium]|nr:Heat shock protein 15 [Flavobacteriales bacterium]MCC6576358.1 RNA-binding S4 domain-containing protein [Flavobacteriales bacterium]NUQ14938.1 RNA-binding S4 domain-containing protein [Flavobacteriales bacterium]
MRIDKFLWCVRLHKSRSLASEACQRGRVRLNDREVKPSAEVGVGDRVAVRQPPIWRVYRITEMPRTRMAAKLVPAHLADETPWEDLREQEMARMVRSGYRPAGEGRPTKRDRRDLDRAWGDEG